MRFMVNIKFYVLVHGYSTLDTHVDLLGTGATPALFTTHRHRLIGLRYARTIKDCMINMPSESRRDYGVAGG